MCAALDRKDRAAFAVMASIAVFLHNTEESKRPEKQEVGFMFVDGVHVMDAWISSVSSVGLC